MADDADLAQLHIERELEMRIAAARGIHQTRARRYCPACGELLEPHRVAAGVCVDCLAEEEARQKVMR